MRDKIIGLTIDREGGYTEDERGGKTKYGITESVARKHGFQGDMKDLPIELAYKIYQKDYWTPLKCNFLPTQLSVKLFDAAVNLGVHRVSKFFQHTLNCLRKEQIYEDGILGSQSLDSWYKLQNERGEKKALQVMLKCINGLQCVHYLHIASDQHNDPDKKYLFGWLDHRIDNVISSIQ